MGAVVLAWVLVLGRKRCESKPESITVPVYYRRCESPRLLVGDLEWKSLNAHKLVRRVT